MEMTNRNQTTLWLLVRLALGLILLWAFFDKLFGLGFATPAASAWVNGGSPTNGFLSHVAGPFGGFYNAIAGNLIIDWLFMLGLLGLGLGLITGLASKLTGWGGLILMVLMWGASLPLKNHPFIDEHIIYGLIFVGIVILPEATAIRIRLTKPTEGVR